jgi:hypothetical protein
VRIGLDFDNTIVCYDQAFFALARETESVPMDLPATKEKVKAYLQAQGRNDFWTELQGLAYGPRMATATVFPGFLDCLNSIYSDHQIFIVSHRSPKPYSGLDCDLHEAAREWLRQQQWVQRKQINLENIFFEATKKGKIQKIKELELDVFIDDLPEIFNDASFPKGPRQILFGTNAEVTGAFFKAQDWDQVLAQLKSL